MDESVQWAMDTYGMSYEEAVEFVESMHDVIDETDRLNDEHGHRCPECGHVFFDEEPD